MTGVLRRILTVIGTGTALLGATVAAHSAQGAPQTPQPANGLGALVQKELVAASSLRNALRKTETADTTAQATLTALDVALSNDRATMAAEAASRTQVTAVPASVTAQPAVNSSTGSSGGGDDSGGGGDD